MEKKLNKHLLLQNKIEIKLNKQFNKNNLSIIVVTDLIYIYIEKYKHFNAVKIQYNNNNENK